MFRFVFYRGTIGTVLFVPLFVTPPRAIIRGTKRTVPFVPLGEG